MPKSLLFEVGKFFSVGYHHAGERIETIVLHEIAEIQLVQLHSPKTARKAEQVWGDHLCVTKYSNSVTDASHGLCGAFFA